MGPGYDHGDLWTRLLGLVMAIALGVLSGALVVYLMG